MLHTLQRDQGRVVDGRDEAVGEEGEATGARRARGGVVYNRGGRNKIRANKKAIRDRRLRVCDGSEDGRTLARVSSAPRACLPLPDRRASDALGPARRLSQVRIEIQIFLNYAPRPATLVPYLLSLIRSLPRRASTAAARPSMPLLHSTFSADMSQLPPSSKTPTLHSSREVHDSIPVFPAQYSPNELFCSGYTLPYADVTHGGV